MKATLKLSPQKSYFETSKKEREGQILHVILPQSKNPNQNKYSKQNSRDVIKMGQFLHGSVRRADGILILSLIQEESSHVESVSRCVHIIPGD